MLIINQMHLIRDDEDGKDLFELLAAARRAVGCCPSRRDHASSNSDDYRVYERLKQLATRMEVISVADLLRAPGPRPPCRSTESDILTRR